jgi:hypothetical protein
MRSTSRDDARAGDATAGRRHEVRWRLPLLAAGLAALGYGAWLLVTGGRATAPVGTVMWAGAALVVHDAVLAPLAVAAAWLLTRVLSGAPRAVSRVIGVGALVGVSLVLVALPALLSPGIDNPTATPRDYGRGLLLLLAVDVAAVAAAGGFVVALRTVSARRTGGRRPPSDPPAPSR